MAPFGRSWESPVRRTCRAWIAWASLVTFFLGWAAGPAIAESPPTGVTSYYVSPNGDDAAAGTSPDQAWRTLSRANTAPLRPGDQLLLEGSATFTGPLVPDMPDAPEASRPVVISSYGIGVASIDAGPGRGIYIAQAGGVTLSKLHVTGAGPDRNDSDGVLFHADESSPSLAGVRVRDVQISGFGRWGLALGTHALSRGYSEVRFERVSAHHNGLGGILTYADRRNLHRDVHADGCTVYSNHGRRGLVHNSGSGIVFGAVDGGSIVGCRAFDNGGLNDARDGGIGIWAYDSRGLLIERNESYANRTGGATDGGGFDLDHNVSDSIVQDNRSHDNDGAGYFLYQGPDTAAHGGNVLRRNVSVDDGRRNGYGGIRIGGRNPHTLIEDNVVEMTRRTPDASAPLEIWVPHGGGYEGLTIIGNRFVTREGQPLVENMSPPTTPDTGLHMSANAFEATGGFLILWQGGSFTDMTSWLTHKDGAVPTRPPAAVPVSTPAAVPAPAPVLPGSVISAPPRHTGTPTTDRRIQKPVRNASSGARCCRSSRCRGRVPSGRCARSKDRGRRGRIGTLAGVTRRDATGRRSGVATPTR